jgi:hypothetical protein
MPRTTRKWLANLYGVHYETFRRYCRPHKKRIDNLKTIIKGEIRQLSPQQLNRRQIIFIIKNVFKDTPEGYELDNGRLIKLKDL